MFPGFVADDVDVQLTGDFVNLRGPFVVGGEEGGGGDANVFAHAIVHRLELLSHIAVGFVDAVVDRLEAGAGFGAEILKIAL